MNSNYPSRKKYSFAILNSVLRIAACIGIVSISCGIPGASKDDCFCFGDAIVCIPELRRSDFYIPNGMSMFSDSVRSIEVVYLRNKSDHSYKAARDVRMQIEAARAVCSSLSSREFYLIHNISINEPMDIQRILRYTDSIPLGDDTVAGMVTYVYAEIEREESRSVHVRLKIPEYSYEDIYEWYERIKDIRIEEVWCIE